MECTERGLKKEQPTQPTAMQHFCDSSDSGSSRSFFQDIRQPPHAVHAVVSNGKADGVYSQLVDCVLLLKASWQRFKT